MSDDLIAYSLSQHPDPSRGRVGLGALLYGLFMAPIAWAADLILDYALVAHGCYPGSSLLGAPLPHLRWIDGGILWFHLVALVLIVSGLLVSYRSWRVTGGPEDFRHHIIKSGEGRTRYLGIVGMGFSAMFFLITAAETVSLAWLPLCTF